MKVYKWRAESNDGAFDDHSKTNFKTEEEAYNDMRNAVLEKMKWNTEYRDDFSDLEPEDYIGYEVRFQKDKIVHKSYSGTYTYEVYSEDVTYCLIMEDSHFGLCEVHLFKTLEAVNKAFDEKKAEIQEEMGSEGSTNVNRYGYRRFIAFKSTCSKEIYIIEGINE